MPRFGTNPASTSGASLCLWRLLARVTNLYVRAVGCIAILMLQVGFHPERSVGSDSGSSFTEEFGGLPTLLSQRCRMPGKKPSKDDELSLPPTGGWHLGGQQNGTSLPCLSNHFWV